MIEAVVTGLIYFCILALVIYLVIWVLQSIGIPLPPMVLKIIWIIVALIAILWLVHTFLPGGHLVRIGGMLLGVPSA